MTRSEYCGRLTWKNVRRPVLKKWMSNKVYDLVSGYIQYEDKVSCQRQILYVKKKFWVFTDFVLTNKSNMKVESYFHFDSAVDIKVDEKKSRIMALKDQKGIVIKYFINAKISVQKEGKKPSEGWMALGYGIKKAAWRVKIIWESAEHNGIFPFLIVPWQKSVNEIHFNGSEWKIDENALFKTELAINEKNFKVAIDKEMNIKVVGDGLNINATQ